MSHNNSSNDTLALNGVIENDVERFIWAGWLILMFLTSLLGDTAILVASIKYRAFKLNRVIVVFIQHVAMCDLIISTTVIFPQIVTLITDSWVFGKVLCWITAYLDFYATCASIILICTMIVGKWLILKYPMKARSWSINQAHILCACLWIFSLSSVCILLLVDPDDVYVNANRYKCSYQFSSKTWNWLTPTIYALYVVFPTSVMILVSIFLVKHLHDARRVARQSRNKVRWQGVATVVITAAVYCFSFLPDGLNILMQLYIGNKSGRLYFSRIAKTFTYLNVASNFFVYIFAVPSFRNFIRSRLCQTRPAFRAVIMPPSSVRKLKSC